MKKYISALNLILFTVFITHWCEERDGRTNSNKLKGRSRNYESNSFYQDAEVYALASLSQNCYQNHETYKGIYDEIWNNEQALRDAADARETQGIWKTVGGVFLVVGGTVCIVASGGAATPIVAAGWTAGGGTIAFASSAFIPISQAARVGNLTFRSGVTTVAKEGIAMMAGAGASDVTMRVTGSQTASLVAGMIASGATGRGLNGVDTRFNISGNKWYLKSAYKEFKRLGADKQIEVFKNMNSKEIYNLVKRSPEAWAKIELSNADEKYRINYHTMNNALVEELRNENNRFLFEVLGNPTVTSIMGVEYDYCWGKILSFFDNKSAEAGIVIEYI